MKDEHRETLNYIVFRRRQQLIQSLYERVVGSNDVLWKAHVVQNCENLGFIRVVFSDSQQLGDNAQCGYFCHHFGILLMMENLH